jgi:hypothetical protein
MEVLLFLPLYEIHLSNDEIGRTYIFLYVISFAMPIARMFHVTCLHDSRELVLYFFSALSISY